MRILFLGTPQFAVPSLRRLRENFEVVGVVTRPDKPAGRGKVLTPPPVKLLSESLGIPVYQPGSARELLSLASEIKPDCAVVVAYGRILPAEFLRIPPRGVVNLHASLLPKFRGAAPIQRALMAGEKVTGNTVMLVNERLDAGDILAQEKIPVKEDDNCLTLSKRLSLRGADLLVKTLELWFRGEIDPVPQREEEATYAPPVLKEELRICWKAPAFSVRDRIRGLYPNAYTLFRGRRIKILRVVLTEGEGEPGEILRGEGFRVACGEGAVKILELISPKGRRISGEEFLRGYSPEEGELLK